MPDSFPQDILSMAATVTSYDHLFGPDHPHTLAAMSHLGVALWRAGDPERGRKLLERAVLGFDHHLPRGHSMSLLALGTLGELLFEQGDFWSAYQVQREVLERLIVVAGADHLNTKAAERHLAATRVELMRCTQIEQASGFGY